MFRKLRILCADDNIINLNILNRMLKCLHVREIVLVKDGQQAADAVAARSAVGATQSPFDVVLMDMQMPVMDGVEATECIRANDRVTQCGNQPVIIAMTANAMHSHRTRCLAAGMNAFLTKPIRIVVLREGICAALNETPL